MNADKQRKLSLTSFTLKYFSGQCGPFVYRRVRVKMYPLSLLSSALRILFASSVTNLRANGAATTNQWLLELHKFIVSKRWVTINYRSVSFTYTNVLCRPDSGNSPPQPQKSPKSQYWQIFSFPPAKSILPPRMSGVWIKHWLKRSTSEYFVKWKSIFSILVYQLFLTNYKLGCAPFVLEMHRLSLLLSVPDLILNGSPATGSFFYS